MKRLAAITVPFLAFAISGCVEDAAPQNDVPIIITTDPQPPESDPLDVLGPQEQDPIATTTPIPATPVTETVSVVPPGPERIDVPAMQNVRDDVLPLYVLGDVNEDGRVDGADVDLIAALANDRTPASATCAAAADFTRDGIIDGADVDALAGLVSETPLPSHVLYAQPYLPCSYSNLKFAASADLSDGPMRIRAIGELEGVEVWTNVGEAASASDGMGWDVYAELGPDQSLTAFLIADGELYTYTLTLFEDDEEIIEEFVDAGEDPGDVGPPTPFGEELEPGECEQEGMGCEALVIDIMKHNDLFFSDADRTAAALEDAECNVTYVAPSFHRPPQPIVLYQHPLFGTVEIPPSAAAINRVIRHNAGEWTTVKAAIGTHRQLVAQGRHLAIQLVNSHGSPSRTLCGGWGPGFRTRAGYLWRHSFHRGNYRAAHGNTCYSVAEDRSCYSGLTPQVVGELNNHGTASCAITPQVNHGYHASYYGDIAVAPSAADNVCRNGEVTLRDVGMGAEIADASDFDDLAQRFRNEALTLDSPSTPFVSTQGRYSDRGHNRRPGTFCSAASHVQAY